MIRITKLAASIGLVIALGAIAAGPAPAAEFHSESSHTAFLGEQHAGEDTLTFNAGTIRCSHATYEGTESSATHTTLRVTPSYTGCKAFGFVNTTIDVNGCTFVFHTTPGTTSIDCPAGQTITTTAYNCWITTGSQGPLSGVTYTNQGSGVSRDITLDVGVSGTKYTQHSKSFPGCSSGTFTNGTYTGATTFRGADTAGSQVGIWVQ